MRYWDASALAPLVVREEGTERMRAFLAEDGMIVTWGWTRVELVGAVERRVRQGRFDRVDRRRALDELELLWDGWNEVTDLLAVRARATSLLARHPLRAADAGQLGAALLVAEQGGPGFTFVCLDQRLGEAAEREGLRVLC